MKVVITSIVFVLVLIIGALEPVWAVESGSVDNTIARIQVQSGHTLEINSLATSPNGQLMVSASVDMTLRVYTLSGRYSGSLLRVLKGHTQSNSGGVRGVLWNPGDSTMLASYTDREVLIWNVNNGCFLRLNVGSESIVKSIAFDQNNYIAVACWNPAQKQGEILTFLPNSVVQTERFPVQPFRFTEALDYEPSVVRFASKAGAAVDRYLFVGAKDRRENAIERMHYVGEGRPLRSRIRTPLMSVAAIAQDTINGNILVFESQGKIFHAYCTEDQITPWKNLNPESLKDWQFFGINSCASSSALVVMTLRNKMQHNSNEVYLIQDDALYPVQAQDLHHPWMMSVPNNKSKVAFFDNISDDLTEYRWTVHTGILQRTSTGVQFVSENRMSSQGSQIRAVALAHNLSTAFSGDNSGYVIRWDLTNAAGGRGHRFGSSRIFDKYVSAISYSYDDSKVLLCGNSGSLKATVYNSLTAKKLSEINLKPPQGKPATDFKLASFVSGDNIVLVHDEQASIYSSQLELKKQYPLDVLHGILTGCISADQTQIYLWCRDQRVYSVSIATGEISTLSEKVDCDQKSAMFSYGQKELLFAGLSGLKRLVVDNNGHSTEVSISSTSVITASVDVASQSCIVITETPQVLVNYNSSSGTLVENGKQPLIEYAKAASVSAVRSNGKATICVYGSEDGTVCFINTSNLAQQRPSPVFLCYPYHSDKPRSSANVEGSDKNSQIKDNQSYADFDCLVYTSDQRYDTPDQYTSGFRFVADNEAYPLGSFFERNYAPGILSLIAETSYQGLQPQRMKQPPIVRFLGNRDLLSQYKHDTLLVTVEFVIRESGLRKAQVYRNGKLLEDLSVTGFSDSLRYSVLMSYEFGLVLGQNDIRIDVEDNDGTKSSDNLLVNAQFEQQQDKHLRKLYVLSVGVNQYRDNAAGLQYAVNDAMGIDSAFRQGNAEPNQQYPGGIEIKTLLDHNATRANIQQYLNELSVKVKESDAFVFFFAGHGQFHADANGGFYSLVLHDVSNFNDPDQLRRLALPIDTLKILLREIAATKQALILDACYSGKAVSSFGARKEKNEETSEEKKFLRNSGVTRRLESIQQNNGVYVLASVQEDGLAKEDNIHKHGLFSYYVQQGLTSAEVANRRRDVSPLSLKEHLDYLYEEGKLPAQRPQLLMGPSSGLFVLTHIQ